MHVKKKVCITTDDDKYLNVTSKKVALLHQTAVNLKDANSDSSPTGGNNRQLLRLSCLVRMIELSCPENKVDQIISSFGFLLYVNM